jgi:hypothetical protein
MKALTASMSNLELAKIEMSPVTLRSEKFRPKLDDIDENYIEMSPLAFKSKSDEKLASTDVIVVHDNAAASPVYASPKPMFKARFKVNLSPALTRHMEKIDQSSPVEPTPDETDKP